MIMELQDITKIIVFTSLQKGICIDICIEIFMQNIKNIYSEKKIFCIALIGFLLTICTDFKIN